MLVKYTRANDSVKKFLKFLMVMHANNEMPLRPYTNKDLYNSYVEYCLEAKLDYFAQRTFSSELTRYGIMDIMGWDTLNHKTARVRNLTEDSIARALRVWVDNSDIHVSLFDINGEKYRMTLKLEKLTNFDSQPAEKIKLITE